MMLRILKRTIYPHLRNYLEERGLVLPVATRIKIANQTGLSVGQVQEVADLIKQYLLQALDQWVKE